MYSLSVMSVYSNEAAISVVVDNPAGMGARPTEA